MEEKSIVIEDNKFVKGGHQKQGFTLIELLVVIAIISLLLAISGPVFIKLRRQGRTVRGISNKKQIVRGAGLYALDNNGRYPESIATLGQNDDWNWTEPMMLTGYRGRSPGMHRSMSAYLRSYIEDASIMYCPNAPRKYKYLQAAWDAGDDWDNPETGPVKDPVSGTYCFYWNYTGYLEGKRYLFKGSRNSTGGRWQSKLMVSCYFGYDHHRSRGAYGSCERFKGASTTQGTLLSSAYWSREGDVDSGMPEIKLYAGYTDEHVESYSASETAAMRVIWKTKINEPYPDGVGPGVFYLPRNGLR